MPKRSSTNDVILPIKRFANQTAWKRWLGAHHASSSGIWMAIAKNGSGLASVSYADAIDGALCYGWIDGQKQKLDECRWLQKFTPRGKRSIWSEINRAKAEKLIACGEMKAPGAKAIAAAKKEGRWDRAYASQRAITVPDDLASALRRNPKAQAFFDELNSANRYAILFRIHAAKKPETRERRLRKFVTMLEKHELIHK